MAKKEEVKKSAGPVADKAPRTSALKAELEKEKERLLKLRAPARELHDKHANDPKFLAAKKLLKDTNPKLAAVENELAKLARAGGSKGIAVNPGVYEGK